MQFQEGAKWHIFPEMPMQGFFQLAVAMYLMRFLHTSLTSWSLNLKPMSSQENNISDQCKVFMVGLDVSFMKAGVEELLHLGACVLAVPCWPLDEGMENKETVCPRKKQSGKAVKVLGQALSSTTGTLCGKTQPHGSREAKPPRLAAAAVPWIRTRDLAHRAPPVSPPCRAGPLP